MFTCMIFERNDGKSQPTRLLSFIGDVDVAAREASMNEGNEIIIIGFLSGRFRLAFFPVLGTDREALKREMLRACDALHERLKVKEARK